MDATLFAALLSSVDTTTGLAQLLALCWLIWRYGHLEKAVSDQAKLLQRAARRVAHISGHLGLDDTGE